ncbi:Urokinase plasminogen activator surface receptor [Varanus komodoensis]|uniref:Urokinase plasminogen activator surface receptor n=1 Tax=Varanus komodoensis TaxID=61221 RepID=A0A8D2JEB4_VARKO|nr:urokinase plasminogen activator surface receptor-like [Varanus komodoensis]KAF7242390.1 Urokinase plasminogen activator surface receptor [Varanus komodoensis]
MRCVWIGFLLSLAVAHVASLECYSCDGDRDCQETETCAEYQEQCRTTIMSILVRSRLSSYIRKGCDVGGKPNNSLTHFSGKDVVFLVEEHCDTDLCNRGIPPVMSTITARGHHRSRLDCNSCASSAETCFNTTLVPLRCTHPGESCVDITSFTGPKEFPADEQRIKGCGQLSQCQEPLGFHNLDSFHLIKCCNTSRCNDDRQDYKNTPLPWNGVTCFSCEGNATHGCSPESISKVQCQGPMTQCLEASGIHGISGENAVLKGCASPSWCDSPYTSVYKNLGAVHSRCCTGDFCNNQIVDGTLRPSPRSRASHEAPAPLTLLSTSLLLAMAFLMSSESS